MKKILSFAVALSMLCSMSTALFTTVSAEVMEPDSAAIVLYDGGLKNGFEISKWGKPGTFKEQDGKLYLDMGNENGNELRRNDVYIDAADWIDDGAFVMDVNLQTTLTDGSSKLGLRFDTYRRDGETYTQKYEGSSSYMYLQKDLVAAGEVHVQTGETYERIAVPFDKTAGGWTGKGNADLADENRFFKSMKFYVKNANYQYETGNLDKDGNPEKAWTDDQPHDTALLDKVAFAHTSATEVDTVSYYAESGLEVTASGEYLDMKPGSIKIKVKNFGLVDDRTLDGIVITDGGNVITTDKSFDMSTNTITLDFDPDDVEFNKYYYLTISGVEVYGGNAVADYFTTFTVRDATALDSYRLLDYAGNDITKLPTTDLDTIELNFTNANIDPKTIGGFYMFTQLGMPVSVTPTKVDKKVNIKINDDLEDGAIYTLIPVGVTDLSGGDIICSQIEIKTQNTVVFFDDEAQNGFEMGTRDSAVAEFKHTTTNAKSFSGTTSIQVFKPTDQAASEVAGKPTGVKGQFSWKFRENNQKQDWTEYAKQNWSFSYWMAEDKHATTTVSGKPYYKMGYWHTFILGSGKWHSIPASQNVTAYALWTTEDEWTYISYPLSIAENSETAPWNEVDQLAGGPDLENNVYFDDIKLVANTRIIPKSITLKDAAGEVLETTGVTPAAIEVAFTGNLNRNKVKDGVSITNTKGESVGYDYKVDYENSVINITPNVSDYVADETYTVLVDGLTAFGGAGQKRTLSTTFTTPEDDGKGYTVEYVLDNATVTEGKCDTILVNVNVGEWDPSEEYVIYLALYEGNRFVNAFSQPSSAATGTLTAELESEMNIGDYELKVFVWDGMTPIF